MLKVIDGLKTLDGANLAVDIAAQSVTAQVNSTGVDCSNFSELLAIGRCNAVTGTGTGQIVVQESNEAAANFTNITGAAMNFTAANTARVLSVDLRSPTRKKYLRLAAFNATNAVTLSGMTLRLTPKRGGIGLDGAAAQV